MKFYTIRISLIAILFTYLPAQLQAQCPNLLWADEFDGTSLNTSNWTPTVSGGGFGNNELQYYTDRSSNLKVEDGKLVITARQENYNTYNYTSAKITTEGKHFFKYGRFEASIKLPRTQGLWPAFWMMPENSEYGGWPSSGEIDIMEGIGNNTFKNFGTIHYGATVAQHKYYGNTYTGVFDLAEGFHTYAVEWEPDTIKWFIDNHLFHIARPSDIAPAFWPYDKEFYLILNLAVGGWFGGNPNSTTVFPQTLEVDYVRVYENPYTLLIAGNERVLEDAVKTYTIENGTATSYDWSVPEGTTITSGQGTKEITVKWGNTGGKITVAATTESCGVLNLTKEVIVIPQACDLIFDDFESNRMISFNSATGTTQNVITNNPNPSSVNNSPMTGYYTRNSIQYDLMYYDVDIIDNSTEYENGNKVLYMDLYTNAPVGSIINWQMENKERANLDYPSGRRAVFVGTTTVQNQWERIKFTLSSKPDLNTSPTSIDQFTILFRPNTYNSYNFYMDNLMSRDVSSCGPVTNILSSEFKSPLEVSPNPSSDLVNVRMKTTSPQAIQIRITDVMGVPLMTKNAVAKDSELNELLDVSSLTPGMYMLYIQQGDKITSQKICIY